MSSLQWEFSERGGTTVVELSGYLNDASLEQFNGAVGWVLAVGNGPIVLDLGGLRSRCVGAVTPALAPWMVRRGLASRSSLTWPRRWLA